MRTHLPHSDDGFASPLVTVDVVLLALIDDTLQVRLIRREREPAKDQWALPGGFVHAGAGEDRNAEDSARRVLENKVGAQAAYLEQLYTFSGQHRDARGWSVSVAYVGLMRDAQELTNTPDARWVSVDDLPELAFDHAEIVHKAMERVRNKALYSSLPVFFLPEAFTLTELLGIYQKVLGQPLEQSAFRRKIEAQGLIEPIDSVREHPGAGRPARLYRMVREDLHDFGKVLRRPPGP